MLAPPPPPPPAIEADIYPCAPPPQFIPPLHIQVLFMTTNNKLTVNHTTSTTALLRWLSGPSMLPQYNPPQDASMYGLNQLPPPPAYQPQGVRSKTTVFSAAATTSPFPAYGSRVSVGPSAGMVGARRMQGQKQKPIWKCDINPL